MPNFILEDNIEKALVGKLKSEYGWQVYDCFTDTREDLNDGSGRANKSEVIFYSHLRTAALKLNPGLPPSAIDSALAKLIAPRTVLSLISANQEIDELLRDGIPVEYSNAQGRKEYGRVHVLDFNTPHRNEFMAVRQLWIKGNITWRRPDVLLYVNGIPLVMIELKNSNVKLKTAYDDNLTNYKQDIPRLFHFNSR